ncbi:MAG: cobalt ABC transporter ATP-binding protein [Bacteroidetes bacterium]|nr:MAG: cobalt ABC transporter ATP-binding protein [Bacteroidota bacterium]
MPVKHKSLFEIQIPECEGDILQVQDLHFSYPDGHQALRGIDLSVCEGEKVALVGPNGAGKSTLMLHLNGILGEHSPVSIAGLAVNKQNMSTIRALVGLVFQNPDDQLFSPTVFDDVAFGPLHMGLPEEEVIQRVTSALEAVQMEDFGDRLSHHLSMGQKKRIAIATVLAMQPYILVLDEPSAGLDPRARRSLINFLKDLPITMLVSTHDLRMVEDIFPRMVIMDEGKIVADGYSRDLLQDDDLLEAHGLESPHLSNQH